MPGTRRNVRLLPERYPNPCHDCSSHGVWHIKRPPLDSANTYAALKGGAPSLRVTKRAVFDEIAGSIVEVIDRTSCKAAETISGPAIIEDLADTYLPPGWSAIVDPSAALDARANCSRI